MITTTLRNIQRVNRNINISPTKINNYSNRYSIFMKNSSSINNNNKNNPTAATFGSIKIQHDPSLDPNVPYKNLPPIARNELIHQKRARLIYQSRKRGILETDLLLSTFAKKYLNEFTEQELNEYDELLNVPDWDIYYFAIDQKPVPERWNNSEVFKKLRTHVKNEGKEILRMPDLY